MQKGDKVVVINEDLSAYGQEGVVISVERTTSMVKARMNVDGYTMEYNSTSLAVIS